MAVVVSWVVALCSLVVRNQRFGGRPASVFRVEIRDQGYVSTELLPTRHNSVGIALGYGLDDRGSRVRFLVGAGNFSLHYRVQNVSGAHPASCPMCTRGSYPGSKAAVA
jgi:hypothetical protein